MRQRTGVKFSSYERSEVEKEASRRTFIENIVLEAA